MNSKKFSFGILALTLLTGASMAFANDDENSEPEDSCVATEEVCQVTEQADASDCSCCDESEETTEE